MSATQLIESAALSTNPLDLAEQLIHERDWLCDRPADDELVAEFEGGWCNYRIWFNWQEDLGGMVFTCTYDMKVAPSMASRLHGLLAAINERLWIGHFDLGSQDGVIMFRHGLLLSGGQGVNPDQLEDLIDIGINECNRFYPAFQSVLWGGSTVEQALTYAMIDTVGEA